MTQDITSLINEGNKIIKHTPVRLRRLNKEKIILTSLIQTIFFLVLRLLISFFTNTIIPFSDFIVIIIIGFCIYMTFNTVYDRISAYAESRDNNNQQRLYY